MFIFVQVQGNSAGQQNCTAVKLPARARGMDAPSQRDNFNHPREIGFAFHGAGTNTLSILRINSPKFGGGLKFEPVDKSRLSGTPELGKRERFSKVSFRVER